MNKKWIDVFLLYGFILYLLLLYEVLMGISGGLNFHATRHRPNFVPFVDIIEVYSMGLGNMLKQVVLNIVIMIPFGLLLPLVIVKFQSFIKTVGTVLGVSILMEILQYFVGRSADIDDVIMNVTGAIIGYLCFKCVMACIDFFNRVKTL